ncbi:DUF1196 domain-containing protein, partial [Vibrio cholerae]
LTVPLEAFVMCLQLHFFPNQNFRID